MPLIRDAVMASLAQRDAVVGRRALVETSQVLPSSSSSHPLTAPTVSVHLQQHPTYTADTSPHELRQRDQHR
jgi:hypothetical protein